MNRRAFTLVELLVVIGMIAVLMGAMGSSIGAARKRAQIARATQEAKEMTNAIIAFENYAPRRFAEKASDGWMEATQGSLSMILGGENSDSGENVPVLYNAHIVGNKVRDPWGKPYEFVIRKAGDIDGKSGANQRFVTALGLPNFHRLGYEERE